jgi:hypothetical protein
MRPTYTAVCERSAGWWAIRVVERPGIFTQARRLDLVESTVRDAIALFDDRPLDSFEVELRAVPPGGTEGVVTQAREARAEADAAQDAAGLAVRAAVVALTRQGVSMRDIGALLGLSHQRIGQLIGEVDRPATA